MLDDHREKNNIDGIDEEIDDTQSLTASDFEVLNKENFFDRINDAFTHSAMANKPKAPSAALGKVVCKCRKVGEGNLLAAIEKNNNITFEELLTATGAATACGKCRPEIEAFLQSQKNILAL